MSNAYTIYKEEGLVFEVWAGKISKEELIHHVIKHINDPALPAAPKLLVDISAASFDHSIGEKEIDEFVNLYRERRDKLAGAKVAVVATHDFDRAKKYERKAITLSIDVIVFNEIGTACAWLGIDMNRAREWMNSKRAELLSTPTVKKKAG